MIQRRFLSLLLGVVMACAASATWSQSSARLPKVGILSPGRQATEMVCLPGNQGGGSACLLEGLRALGYDAGRNITFISRFADGDATRLPALAAELVALQPDVIYTYTTAGAQAAAKATSGIPVVVGPAGERTMERLAGNFARPIGNVTGLTLAGPEQDEKCLQLLKELAPRMASVAVMANPDNPNFAVYLDLLGPAAKRLGITLIRVDARNAADLPQAFAMIRSRSADAILIGEDQALAGTPAVRQQIIRWALEQRLPLASSSARVAPDGGLVSLGTDNSALVKRAAFYVHRILGGARPADLPVERPTVYKLSLNSKTAAALGITIPQALLLRADEVIQ